MLFGNFGMGNLGNDCTLRALLYHLCHLLPGAAVSCICTGPEATSRSHNISALPISRTVLRGWKPRTYLSRVLRLAFVGCPVELFRWFEAFKALKRTDVLIIPGTGLLTDAYGLMSWGPYNLFKWSLLAKLRGSRLLFVSVGAGPLHGRLGRVFAEAALALADYRSYRDASSLQYLKQIGFAAAQDQICPDLAFSLPLELIPSDGRPKRRHPVVGLGVMEYAGAYGSETPASYGRYLDALVLFVGWLLTHDYDVRLLTGDAGDRAAKKQFAGMLKQRLPAFVATRVIDEPTDSLEELLLEIAATDFVVATRFHNVLLALLCNKPAIAISFHHKCTSLMASMELSDYCLEITDVTTADLIDKVCQIERRFDPLKRLIRERVGACRRALEMQYPLLVDYILSDVNTPSPTPA